MGFEWQFGTEARAGRRPASGKGGLGNIGGAASTCKSAHEKLCESVSAGSGDTDASACGSTSTKRD